MRRKDLINYIIIFFLISTIPLGYRVGSDNINDWVIDGNTVYIDDSNVYLSATPHTLYSNGWVTFEFETKNYDGDIDLALGVDTDSITPRFPQIWQNYQHTLKGKRLIVDEGTKTFYDVISFTNLGIENYNNYHVDIGTINNTYLFKVIYDSSMLWEKIIAFSDYEINGNDYTVSGEYDREESYIYYQTFYDWKNIDIDFETVYYEHGGMNKWFFQKNINVESGHRYKIRVFMRVNPNTDYSKYWFVVKPSGETIGEAIGNGHFYALDPWFNSDYNYKKQITISNTLFDATVTDYPFLVNITDDSDLYNHMESSDGYDLIFTNGDENLQLDHEIVFWNWNVGDSNVDAYIYVQVPSIAHDVDTDIYMYYGNSGVSTPQHNPTGVWDDNFLAVYHLNSTWDSTGNGYELSSSRSPEIKTDGIVGSCYDFENDDEEYFDCGDILLDSKTAFTVMAFAKKESVEAGGYYGVTSGDDGNEQMQLTFKGSATSLTSAYVKAGGTVADVTGTEVISLNTWYCLATVYDDASGNQAEQWTNGRVKTGTPTGVWGGTDHSVNLGSYDEGTGNTYDGYFDEIFISDVDRGEVWIRGTTDMILNSSSYQTHGAEIEVGYDPEISDPYPVNGSYENDIGVINSITVSDDDGDNMGLTFRWNNSGSWDIFDTDEGGNGTYNGVNGNYTGFYTTYEWNVTVSDGENTNTSSIFTFTTENNTLPNITNPIPANGSIDQDRPPTNSIDVEDADGHTMYIVFRWNNSGSWDIYDTDEGGDGTYIGVNSNFSTSNTTFYWNVSVYDGYNYNDSGIYHFKTLEGVDKPTGFTATRDDTNNDIALTWTLGTNSTYTRIQRANDTFPTTISTGTNIYNNTGSSFTDTSTDDGVTHYYSAWGYNDSLNEWSILYATVSESTRPLAPTSLTVSVIDNDTLNLTWVKGSNSDNTTIRYQEGSYPTNPTDGTEAYNGTGEQTLVESLSTGTTYYFTAWGWNTTVNLFSYANSTGYNTTSFTPSNITNFIVSTYNDTQINLSWTKGNGSHTVIRRKIGSYPSSVTDGDEAYNGTESSYADTGLSPVTVYYYRAWGYQSPLFSEGYKQANDTTLPQAPQNATGTLYGTALNISWDNATGGDTYAVIKKLGSYPTSITDGTEIYNGTLWYYNDTSFAENYFYSIYSWNTTYKLSNGVSVLWGGLQINVYNESSGLAITGWNVFVTNYDTTVTYSEQNNPTLLDINLLPYGNDTIILINASGYLTRIYTLDIEPNNLYTLNAYLPPAYGSNVSHYIITVENLVSQPIENAKVYISRYIGGLGDYALVLSSLTDSNGQIDVNLYPEILYIVTISHEDYITSTTHWQPPTIVYYDDALKTFKLTATPINYTKEYVFSEYITFNGYRDASIVYVNYTDALLMTISTDFIIYEINTTTGNETVFYWYNDTNQTLQFNFTVDPNNHYRVVLSLSHLLFKNLEDSIIIKGDKELPTSKSEFDNLFDGVFGGGALAWSGIIGLFLFLCCLFLFGNRNVGVGIALAGLLMIAINAGLGLEFLNMTISIVVFVFGILVQWRKERRVSG